MVRAFIETPLEYAKIKRQTGQTWHIRHLYTGFGSTIIRAMPLLTNYFIIVDFMRRNHPEWFTLPFIGPYMTSGFAAAGAWWTVWPLEYVRTQIQAGYVDKNANTLSQLKTVIKKNGFFGLYRGIMPGTLRAFTGAGAGMVVMLELQKLATYHGFRNKDE